MTKDGDSHVERVRLLKNRQTSSLSKLSKRRNEIVTIMTSESNLHLVKGMFEAYNETCLEYHEAHADYCEVLTTEANKTLLWNLGTE